MDSSADSVKSIPVVARPSAKPTVRGDQRHELPDMPPRMLQSLQGQLATTPILLELLPDVPCVICCSFIDEHKLASSYVRPC